MKTKYDDLPILPYLLAEYVLDRPYLGQEISLEHRDPNIVKHVEEQRQLMTNEERTNFISETEIRCRTSYESDGWFSLVVQKPDPRNDIIAIISHWLASLLIKEHKNGSKEKIPMGA